MIAVNPGQEPDIADIRNGLNALLRIMVIYNFSHAGACLEQADFVLSPVSHRTVDRLDFPARPKYITARVRTVRLQRKTIAKLLVPDAASPRGPASHTLATPDLASPDVAVPR